MIDYPVYYTFIPNENNSEDGEAIRSIFYADMLIELRYFHNVSCHEKFITVSNMSEIISYAGEVDLLSAAIDAAHKEMFTGAIDGI